MCEPKGKIKMLRVRMTADQWNTLTREADRETGGNRSRLVLRRLFDGNSELERVHQFLDECVIGGDGTESLVYRIGLALHKARVDGTRLAMMRD